MSFMMWTLFGWGAYEGWKLWKIKIAPKPMILGPTPFPSTFSLVPWVANMGTAGLANGGVASFFPPGGPGKSTLSVITTGAGLQPKAPTSLTTGQMDYTAVATGAYPISISWLPAGGGPALSGSFTLVIA